MERTYEVEIMAVYEVVDGKRTKIATLAAYQNLSYDNLVAMEKALTPPVSAVLLGLGEAGAKQKKEKKSK